MDELFQQAAAQLGIAGVALAIAYFVLKRAAVQYDRTIDILIGTIKESDERYDMLIVTLIDVIKGNTAAMAAMEKAVNGLPEFVRQVDRRLHNGTGRFDDHEARLRTLEGSGRA